MSASRIKLEAKRRLESSRQCDWNAAPVLCAPTRGDVEKQIEKLKHELLEPILSRLGDAPLVKEILWAANEAAALAWCTVCPVLVLPALLEEKVSQAIAKWQKQQQMRNSLRRAEGATHSFRSLAEAA